MDSYIELLKINLPDIVAFALIVVAYMSQFIAAIKGKKTGLLAKTFFMEKTNKVDAAYTEAIDTANQIRKRMSEIEDENAELKKRLSSAEAALRAIIKPRKNKDKEEK